MEKIEVDGTLPSTSGDFIDVLRRRIIELDSGIVALMKEVPVPENRYDFDGRVNTAVELARLAGIREGLDMTRLALEEIAI